MMIRFLTAFLGVLLPVVAFGTVVTETEENDSFATANVFGADTTEIRGFRGKFDFDEAVFEEIAPGEVNFVDFFDLTPGEDFFVFIDNVTEIPTGDPDTILRSLDQNFNELDFDDDGSPLGDGFASALGGTVNDDGSIILDVSGFGDDFFFGDHDEEGGYNLYLQLGTSEFVGSADPDVDFFTVVDLTPGELIEITVEEATFDSTLGLFDESGSLIDFDDDSGEGLLSSIVAEVGSSGSLTFAISGFSDFTFDGTDAFGSGFYTITTTVVPEPATLSLLAIGIVVVGRFVSKSRAD